MLTKRFVERWSCHSLVLVVKWDLLSRLMVSSGGEFAGTALSKDIAGISGVMPGVWLLGYVSFNRGKYIVIQYSCKTSDSYSTEKTFILCYED